MAQSCSLCAEDTVAPADWFIISPCHHGMCTSCITRHAANGRNMFTCPWCQGGIENFPGEVPKSMPRWAIDDALVLEDDTTDTALCYGACWKSRLLFTLPIP
jgi:hypothetical protein